MLLGVGFVGTIPWWPAAAQRPSDQLPISPARTITFTTTEGTQMNVDLSPDGLTLVFDLLGDIYTVSLSGGVATPLTRGLGFDRHPAWSPDGTQIAYVSDATGTDNLWIMGADGTHARPVTKVTERDFVGVGWVRPRFAEVEWAPDGSSLVSDDTVFQLIGGKRRLPGVPERDQESSLQFSRDGRYVYFNHEGVRRYDRTTGKTVQLTRPPGPFSKPVVSPDGRWLTYITGVDDAWLTSPAGVRKGSVHNGLRARDLATGEERWLAYPVDQRRDSYERYVFTPDSRAVIIGYGGKLHRIDVATGEDRIVPFTATAHVDLGPFVYHRYRVTNDSLAVRYVSSPTVSPDGNTLVFSALRRLYRMALPRGTPKPLVRQPDGQFQPAYSPDGKWLAYVTWSEVEGGHIWRVSAAGGQPERLTSAASHDYYLRPAWSPDGATLAVLRARTLEISLGKEISGWVQLLPSTGGTPRTLATNVSIQTPVTFTPDGRRIFFQEARGPGRKASVLISVGLEGRDRRTAARVLSPFEMSVGYSVPSPDARYLAYVRHQELYLVPLPPAPDSLQLGGSPAAGPSVRLAHAPLDLRWEQGGRKLTWVVANQVFRVDPDAALAAATRTPDGPHAWGLTSADGSAGTGATTVPRVKTDDMISIRLTVPRHTARGTLALRGARVITMKGDEVLENATIVITNDRITAIGPSLSVALPKGARIIAMRGNTIMPGLVDLHAHFREPRDVVVSQYWKHLASLAYGVTTARDPSASSTDQFGYAELIESGQMLGPRVFSVGKAITPTDFEIAGLDDARAVVQHRQAMGAVAIKQYLQPTRRQRQWILMAAAEAGLNVTNESEHVSSMLTMALDGFAGVEHNPVEVNLYRDVTRLIAEAKTWYTPTLQAWHGSRGKLYFRDRYRTLYEDPKYRRFVPQDEIDRRRSDKLRTATGRGYRDFIDAARRAAEIVHQGGHVTLGSHGDDQGLGAHWELWALQMGGLSNHEALQAATLHGAEGLGMQQDLGSLEVGKIADLLVLDRNPLQNIEHTLSIRYVMKNGVLYDGNTLNTVWPKPQVLPTWMYQAIRRD